MPVPTSELNSDEPSELSSNIEDEPEGIAQKPNVFQNNHKANHSERKTAGGTDYASNPVTPRKQVFNEQESLKFNESDYEIIEGSSIVMELEDSFQTSSHASRRGKEQDQVIPESATKILEPPESHTPEPVSQNLQNSKLSSDSRSHTATFASGMGGFTPKKVQKEETKSQNGHAKATKVKDGVFEYDGPNSEEDDYDSEQEYSYHSKGEQSNMGSQWAPSQAVKSVAPDGSDEIKPESSSQKSGLSPSSGQNYNSSGEKGAQSVITGQKGRNMNSSRSSQHFDSLSTHTSPQFNAPKLLQKTKFKKKEKEKYVSQKDFKKFITVAKRQVSKSRESRGGKSTKSKQRKRWKSPLNIVDKLVDDANQRLKNKRKFIPC
jgi:hypothetical protein